EAMSTRKDDFDYKPHCTLAYVKPDVAEQYGGLDWVEGTTFEVNGIVLSKKGGGKVRVPFGKPLKSASHKTPPMSDTQYRDPERGEETNAYADIPERVIGVEDLPSLESLSPDLFKTGAQKFPSFDEYVANHDISTDISDPEEYNHREYLYDEIVAGLDFDFPLTVFRALDVPAGEQPNYEGTGIYWTSDPNSADSYFGVGSIWGPKGKTRGGKKMELVILEAQVLSPNDVDWDGTLEANVLNPDENEVTIISGAQLRLVKVNEKPVKKRMITAGKVAFGDDSKNLPLRGQKGIGGQDFPVMTEPPLFSDEKEAAAKPKYLYHGTEKKNLDDILKNGLRVEFNESNIEWQKATYLACDTYTAANYAGHKGAKSEDWTVLQIEISKLREDLLRPDDYDFPDMWGRESMHEEVNVEVGELKEE